MAKTVMISARVTGELDAELNKVAAKLDRSKSWVIEAALKTMVAAHGGAIDVPQAVYDALPPKAVDAPAAAVAAAPAPLVIPPLPAPGQPTSTLVYPAPSAAPQAPAPMPARPDADYTVNAIFTLSTPD